MIVNYVIVKKLKRGSNYLIIFYEYIISIYIQYYCL